MTERPNIEFAPDDKIDESAFNLIEDIFGIDAGLLTNESSLFDFDFGGSLPGHKEIPLSEVPLEEQHLYHPLPPRSTPERFYVEYPPLTTEERQRYIETARRNLLTKVEQTYHISMADYDDEKLLVWKLVEYLKSLST